MLGMLGQTMVCNKHNLYRDDGKSECPFCKIDILYEVLAEVHEDRVKWKTKCKRLEWELGNGGY